MATWREIGRENFRAARGCYQAQQYRSSVSRFYYAAYSVLTHELLLASFLPKADREAPDHAHLAEWIKTYLTSVSPRKRQEMASLIRQLYEARLVADYRLRTVDEVTARDSRRAALIIFRYLEVEA